MRQDSDVLLRQLDGHLAVLRAGGADVGAAERVASALRRLVADTNRANAVDRARVRAAVHVFVSRRPGTAATARYASLPGRPNAPRRTRSLRDDLRIVNDILGDLGAGLGG
jgi:hypothetical protein